MKRSLRRDSLKVDESIKVVLVLFLYQSADSTNAFVRILVMQRLRGWGERLRLSVEATPIDDHHLCPTVHDVISRLILTIEVRQRLRQGAS